MNHPPAKFRHWQRVAAIAAILAVGVTAEMTSVAQDLEMERLPTVGTLERLPSTGALERLPPTTTLQRLPPTSWQQSAEPSRRTRFLDEANSTQSTTQAFAQPLLQPPWNPAVDRVADSTPQPNTPPDDLKFPALEDTVIFGEQPLPHIDPRSGPSNYFEEDFARTPTFAAEAYDAARETDTYGEKSLLRTQRPWLELFRPLYGYGPIPPSPQWFGPTNPATPQFLVYGDYRASTAFISNGNGADVGKLANRLNLEMDLRLTATERIHAFYDPFTNANTFTSLVVGDGEAEFVSGLNGNFQTLFFEGDLGAMVGGAWDIDPPFDLPLTFGRIPLLFQNGIWMEDNFLGAAIAIPACNSPALDWSNFDTTFFVATDEISSPAFGTDDSVVNVFGTHTFIEAYGGYLEVGYAYLDDHTGQGLGYNNLGISFQRRYFNAVSNAVRCIVNAGQDPISGPKTANGALILVENVFLTESPYYKLPYANFFIGFDRPQSVARNANAQGVLRNTGINFESDNLTNYPTLDATGNDVYGAAFGIDLLGAGFSHQLIMEGAVLRVLGDDPLRNAKGDQFALGVRYQRPISNSWLFRADAMHGWRENETDISGARMELRHKF